MYKSTFPLHSVPPPYTASCRWYFCSVWCPTPPVAVYTMDVNGRRFLYGGSMGLYHRGPLSPRWKSITQKPGVSFLFSSLPPPPSSSISRPPSLPVSESSCVAAERAPTSLLLFLWQLRKEEETFCLCFCLEMLGGGDAQLVTLLCPIR